MTSLNKSDPGLPARLIAAIWFGLAAMIPIAFFFYIFGWLFAQFEMRWIFGPVPVLIAVFLAFALGGKILSPLHVQGSARAIGRGLLIAFGSYAALFAVFFLVVAVAMFPPQEKDQFANPLGALLLAIIGLPYVGWLIAISGGLAGWTLFWISRQAAVSDWLSRHTGGSRTAIRVMNGVILFLLFASTLPPIVTMRASRHAEIREQRNTALIGAASKGDVAEVQRLLNSGSNVSDQHDAGWPPIIWAAREQHNQVVKLLLDHGANPNVVETGNQNVTPLHWAASGNNLENATTLLAYGADINACNTNGYTPLMLAANQGSPELVRLLLSHHPNLKLRNNQGQTALEFVRAERDTPSVIEVGTSGRWTDPVMIEKARRRHDEIIRLLESAAAGPSP